MCDYFKKRTATNKKEQYMTTVCLSPDEGFWACINNLDTQKIWQQSFGHFELRWFWSSVFLSRGTKHSSKLWWNQMNSIRLIISIPTAKMTAGCEWGAALERERQKTKGFYITRKKKGRNRNTVYVICLYIRKLSWVLHFAKLFFFPEVIDTQKRWHEAQRSQRFGRWASCHLSLLSFHICSVQDILPFQMKKYFLSILCTAYCSNASDW